MEKRFSAADQNEKVLRFPNTSENTSSVAFQAGGLKLLRCHELCGVQSSRTPGFYLSTAPAIQLSGR
ncbi:hypothetical protein Q7C36_003601 [Tachysurus vachellii]|uniref:Uncharacterized protein n=1 Tax=Tachysurus vachellii TaxID=175792 RepID=A0AA88T549_TACVA|nr:hypothetical protein Q7C36_003601 [Tachysurus vachellii]